MKRIYQLLAAMIFPLYVFVLSSCSQSNPPGQVKKDSITLSDRSIYNLTDTFQTQDNQPFQLIYLKGKPVVISMIFTSCQYACPKMTAGIKSIEDSLGTANRGKVEYVLISFDAELDTPEKLKQFATENSLDNNWVLLHASDEIIKKISVLLDIKYEKVEKGSFDHSNKKIILDKNGEIIYTEEGLDNMNDKIVQELRKNL